VSGSLVLAIDTTSELGSIALAEDGRVLEQVALHSPDGFAHMLFGEIEQRLSRHNFKITDLEGPTMAGYISTKAEAEWLVREMNRALNRNV